MEKIKEKFLSLSIIKSLTIIIVINLIIVGSLSAGTLYVTNYIRMDIMEARAFTFTLSDKDAQNQSDGKLNIEISDSNDAKWKPLTDKEEIVYNLCGILTVLLPVIYVVLGVLLISFLFYRIKVKKPLEVLRYGIRNIADNNLDYKMECNRHDELGELCEAMDKMRQVLDSNNKKMWNLVEERKMLNASVAHDLRTPITVLKGYLDYLKMNLPKNKVTEQDLQETICFMSEATNRMEQYVDSVHTVQKLEDIEIDRSAENVNNVIKEIESNLMNLSNNVEIHIINQCESQSLYIDKQILFRIIENLVSNAVNFANNQVEVIFSIDNDNLSVCVKDDGKGFDESVIDNVCHPFFTTERGNCHYGLGLWISTLFCEKHGGCLSVKNEKHGGGCVTATISTESFSNI